MKILYNSSTGNCLYVAKRIKEKFEECELISIPKTMKEEKFEFKDEIIGIVYPIHYGGVPILVHEFLSKVKINNDAYVFVIGVSGGGGANISFNQVSTLLSQDVTISNYCTIKYISNYIKAGRNPSKERALKAIEENEKILDEFIIKIKNKEKIIKKYKYGVGNIGYNLAVKMIKGKDLKFNVSNDCIGCKMCEKICPVQNIIMEDNKPKWCHKCVDCMACINICPKEAINIGKATIKKNRYINPFIKKEELL